MYPTYTWPDVAELIPSHLVNCYPKLQKLFIQGSPKALQLLQRLPYDGLAIVGTRNPCAHSLELVRKEVLQLKNFPLIIVSGLASGIDASAHVAALEAGLPTIAILGTPLNNSYPKATFEIRKKILDADGLMISEVPNNQMVYKSHFLKRNRLIAYFTQATWVVEATARSGSLNTANWALQYHKTCFATPTFPNLCRFAGNQKLLDDHCALSYWGIHSLGSVWLKYATAYKE
jgi:DNA processing protein